MSHQAERDGAQLSSPRRWLVALVVRVRGATARHDRRSVCDRRSDNIAAPDPGSTRRASPRATRRGHGQHGAGPGHRLSASTWFLDGGLRRGPRRPGGLARTGARQPSSVSVTNSVPLKTQSCSAGCARAHARTSACTSHGVVDAVVLPDRSPVAGDAVDPVDDDGRAVTGWRSAVLGHRRSPLGVALIQSVTRGVGWRNGSGWPPSLSRWIVADGAEGVPPTPGTPRSGRQRQVDVVACGSQRHR